MSRENALTVAQRQTQTAHLRMEAWLKLLGTSERPAERPLVQGDLEKTPLSKAAEGVSLSQRQREVADWLAQGKRAKEIAVIFGISTRTVEKHIHGIYRAYGVSRFADFLAKHHGRPEV